MSGASAAPAPRADPGRGALRASLASLPLWAGAAGLVSRALVDTGHGPDSGLDFRPLYSAGRAVARHEPLYAVANFAYPPVAAFVVEPLSRLPYPRAHALFVTLEALGVVGTCAALAVVVVPARRRAWRSGVAALLVLGLFAARPTLRSLGLANLTVLLVPVLLGVCWCWARGRWHAGTALLAASLLVKPVLVPLVLLPLARRRLGALATWGLVAAGLLALAVHATTGDGGALAVLRGLLAATHFTGRDRPLNLSLAGLGTAHGLSPALVDGARLLAAATGLVAVARWARSSGATDGSGGPTGRSGPTGQDDVAAVLAAAAAVLAALFLAGSISEVHYLLLLIPAVVAVLGRGRPWPAALAAGALACFLAAEGAGRDPVTQAVLVGCEVLALGACTAHLVRGRAQQRPGLPDSPPERSTAVQTPRAGGSSG